MEKKKLKYAIIFLLLWLLPTLLIAGLVRHF